MAGDNNQSTDVSQIDPTTVEELKQAVMEMKPKVDKTYDVLFSEDHDVDQRDGIDDIRLMRQIYVRFKSARFIFGAIAGVVTFLATAGFALYKLWQLIELIFKSKTGA